MTKFYDDVKYELIVCSYLYQQNFGGKKGKKGFNDEIKLVISRVPVEAIEGIPMPSLPRHEQNNRVRNPSFLL